MRTQVRVTSTATVERIIEVEVPEGATKDQALQAAAEELAGPEQDGSGEDLTNEKGTWNVIMVDADALRLERESLRLAVPPAVGNVQITPP